MGWGRPIKSINNCKIFGLIWKSKVKIYSKNQKIWFQEFKSNDLNILLSLRIRAKSHRPRNT